MSILNCGWQKIGTKEEIEKALGCGFTFFLGWSECDTDTVLISELEEELFLVQVWNSPTIRSELATLLGSEVRKIVIGPWPAHEVKPLS